MKSWAEENIPRNNMNFLGENEMMLKKVKLGKRGQGEKAD